MSGSYGTGMTDDEVMKAAPHIKPSGTFDLVTPPPHGYEETMDGVSFIEVDPAGVKPTLYFTFPLPTRGWHKRNGQ